MKALVLAAGAAALTVALPGSAEVMTIGGSFAHSCYLSAKARDSTSRALEECSQALTQEALTTHDRFATHVNRGILRMINRDYANAEQDYDRAIALDGRSGEPWLNMAIMRFNQRRAAEAIPLFDRALELGTIRPEVAYYGRALAHEDTGNVRAAYADLRRAVQLKPRWSEPAIDLARYQVRR